MVLTTGGPGANTPGPDEVRQMRGQIDHMRTELAHRDGIIADLEQRLGEAALCRYPIPGVPGHVWVWDKADEFIHCTPAHVEYHTTWESDGRPITGQWVVLDDDRSACGQKVRKNPYHGPPAYYGRECCVNCLEAVKP